MDCRLYTLGHPDHTLVTSLRGGSLLQYTSTPSSAVDKPKRSILFFFFSSSSTCMCQKMTSWQEREWHSPVLLQARQKNQIFLLSFLTFPIPHPIIINIDTNWLHLHIKNKLTEGVVLLPRPLYPFSRDVPNLQCSKMPQAHYHSHKRNTFLL